MYQGTTPTLVFQLDTPIDLTNMAQIWITLRDGLGCKHNWDISRTTVDNEKHEIYLTLTQAETLRVKPGLGAVQIRFLTNTGIALTTERRMVTIAATLKGGIIS